MCHFRVISHTRGEAHIRSPPPPPLPISIIIIYPLFIIQNLTLQIHHFKSEVKGNERGFVSAVPETVRQRPFLELEPTKKRPIKFE